MFWFAVNTEERVLHGSTVLKVRFSNEMVLPFVVGCCRYLATAGIASDWPFGRGCYVSEDRKFVIWVGEEDHLRIMCMFKGTVLNDVFDRLKTALDVVNGIEGL